MKIQIEANKVYEITIGKNKTTIKVLKVERRVNGQLVYDCLNTNTNKRMTVSDAKRFLREIKVEKPVKDTNGGNMKTDEKAVEKKEHPEKAISGLTAAYIVLKDAAEPLNIRQIMERINEQGLSKLGGKTPGATVVAAILREIKDKNGSSRFVKPGKGLFAAR